MLSGILYFSSLFFRFGLRSQSQEVAGCIAGREQSRKEAAMPAVQIWAAPEPVKLSLNGRGGPRGSLTVHGHWKKKLLLSWEDTWSVASRERGSTSASPTLDMSLYEISTMSTEWTFLCNIESLSKVTLWVSFEPYRSVFMCLLLSPDVCILVATIQFASVPIAQTKKRISKRQKQQKYLELILKNVLPHLHGISFRTEKWWLSTCPHLLLCFTRI